MFAKWGECPNALAPQADLIFQQHLFVLIKSYTSAGEDLIRGHTALFLDVVDQVGYRCDYFRRRSDARHKRPGDRGELGEKL